MTEFPSQCNVAIIGSGPSGLACAIALCKLGVTDILVLERSAEAGGNPRHCGHSPFGMTEFKRIYKGPAYARKLVQTALQLGVRIELNASVIALAEYGQLTLSLKQGEHRLSADRVLLATGIREMPRAPRFVSGQRPLGIVTTGALQSMVYLSHQRPFERPVIVGSELVSFSAVASCRHGGMQPQAMLEPNSRVTAPTALQWYPRLLGVDVLTNTRLQAITGRQRVSGVDIIKPGGKTGHIDCDGVIFSGHFVPEASLARLGHLQIDAHTQGPVVDQFGRCSDASYFAVGNVLRPVETAGWCWREGVQMAHTIAADLAGCLPPAEQTLAVRINSDAIKYVLPQRLALSEDMAAPAASSKTHFQIRLQYAAKGVLELKSAERLLQAKRINTLPERRILLPLTSTGLNAHSAALALSLSD